MRKFLFYAVPLGLSALLIWASPPFNSPIVADAAPYPGIDIGAIEHTAHRNTPLSFDDHHQMYIGILDVLRSYPEP